MNRKRAALYPREALPLASRNGLLQLSLGGAKAASQRRVAHPSLREAWGAGGAAREWVPHPFAFQRVRFASEFFSVDSVSLCPL